MLVGEAPGADEDRSGVPFVGAAGRQLDELLRDAGIQRSDVYITNTVKCRPPANATPTKNNTSQCLPYLIEEIETVQPDVILALGSVAFETLTGKTGITRERGKLLPPKPRFLFSTPVIGTFHPASLLYAGPGNRPLIVDDLRLAASVAHRAGTQGHQPVTVAPGTNPVPASETLRLLLAQGRGPIACDLEWRKHPSKKDVMLWPWNPMGEAYSIAVAGRVDGQAVSVASALPFPDPEVEAGFRAILEQKDIVFHNASADMLWLMSLKLKTRIRGDTMLLAHLIDETQPLGLGALAGRYDVDVDPRWKGGHLRTSRPITGADWEDILTYNGLDTYTTLLLWEALTAAVSAIPHGGELMRVHSRLLIPGLPVLARAAYRGVPIDEALLNRELAAARERYREAVEEFASITGLTPVQASRLVGSPQQVRDYITRATGIQLESTSRDSLALLDQLPQVQAILRCRAETKLISTYLEPWRSLLDQQRDGRLHTVYRPTGARTGRMSAEIEDGGSLQVTPRNSPRVAFREMVAAPPGWVIVAADYSQIELRVGAWIAREPTMLQLIREGEDLHYVTAAFLLANGQSPIAIQDFWAEKDRWISRVTKEDRQAAKGVNFGLLYGMEEDKFITYSRTQYGITMDWDQAHLARQSYMRLYSRLLEWHEESRARALRGEETVTPFGRRRRYTPENANAAINTPVQSTASDLTLLAMVQADRAIREAGIRAHPIGFVHDSILFECREADADEVARLLVHVMVNVDTSEFGFTVPVPLAAETKIGRTWG